MAVLTKSRVTEGKAKRIDACADERGIIRAAAMDQRGSLKQEIGRQGGQPTGESLTEFKTAVTKVLTRHATAILMDPEYGLPALKARRSGSGVLLAYEKTGYDADPQDRKPDLLEHWSARRLIEAGADAIKILLYYDPFDEQEVNDRKHAFLERIGAECKALDVPFFLEPLAYDKDMDERGFDYAKLKPKAVQAYMEKLSEPRFGVDVLKVEVPVNMAFVGGSKANTTGQIAYDRRAALKHFKDASDAASLPFIYLSAGVTNEVFNESIEWAGEAGAKFAGVLCGRATWQRGIPVYAKEGLPAFTAWLEKDGVANIQALNAILSRAAPPGGALYGSPPQPSPPAR